MCGRFNVIDNPELQSLLRELGIDLRLPTRTNIAPTEMIAMLRETPQGRELAQVRWWLTPSWSKQVDQKYAMFNARSETLADSRAYGEPFRRRRGIVPMSSFIEWRAEEGGRQPYLVAAERGALAVAAVWEHWQRGDEVVESCSVVTTAAAEAFQQFHKRMPVILDSQEANRWLDCQRELPADDPLFEPRLKQGLRVVAISRGVNNARNKEVELLQPQGEALRLAG